MVLELYPIRGKFNLLFISQSKTSSLHTLKRRWEWNMKIFFLMGSSTDIRVASFVVAFVRKFKPDDQPVRVAIRISEETRHHNGFFFGSK